MQLVKLVSGSLALVALPLALALPACAPTADPTDSTDDDTSEGSEDALTSENAISRGEEWVNAKLHYCQSANHQRDYDSACSKYCDRKDVSAWDPYRSDCSGFVSWSWGLPAPGRTTLGFAPYQNDVSHVIEASSLRAGDAINNSDHIMLFKKWITKNKRAEFLEEPGCSSSEPYAKLTTTNVTVSGHSIHVAENGMTFTAIRFDKITKDPKSGPNGDKCFAKCKNRQDYHEVEGVTSGCNDAAKAYCELNDRGAFQDAKWAKKP